MGRRIVYCEACGLRLSEDDFRLGKAGVHLLRPFCSTCRPVPPQVLEALPRRPQARPVRALRVFRSPSSLRP